MILKVGGGPGTLVREVARTMRQPGQVTGLSIGRSWITQLFEHKLIQEIHLRRGESARGPEEVDSTIAFRLYHAIKRNEENSQ